MSSNNPPEVIKISPLRWVAAARPANKPLIKSHLSLYESFIPFSRKINDTKPNVITIISGRKTKEY